MKRFLILTAALIMASCSMLAPEEESGGGGSTFETGSSLVAGDSLPDAVKQEGSRVEVESDREDFVCYEIRIKETRNFTDISNLGMNDDILYPGALIDGTGAASGSLTTATLPYGVSRQPVTLSLGGISGTDASLAFTVDNPALSASRDAINQKLGDIVGASAAARIEFQKEEVYSKEQLALSLGVGVEWPTGQSVSGQIDSTTTEEKSRMVVRFRQIYYSVDMDTPQGYDDLFSGGDAETIDAFIEEKKPLYVSRVFYGRQVFFVMESSCSSEELTVAVEAAMKKGVEGLEAEISINSAMTTQSVLANTTITAIVYGGDSEAAVQTINGYDGLVAFLGQGGTFDASTGSSAMPLYYQMRFVEDNKIGAITTNAEYTIKQYVRTKQRVRVELDRYYCTGSDDGWLNSTSEMKGEVRVRAMNNDGSVATDWVVLHDFWDSPWDMNEGNEYDAGDRSTILTFDDLDADNSYIELYMKFVEDDASDDFLGEESPKIYLRDNWNKEFSYTFENEGEGIRPYINISIIP